MMAPTQFKLTKSNSLTRRTNFNGRPTWQELGSKVASLYDIPFHKVGVSYVDKEEDTVIVTSDEELQDFYTLTYQSPQLIRLRVHDLRSLNDFSRNDSAVTRKDDRPQRLPDVQQKAMPTTTFPKRPQSTTVSPSNSTRPLVSEPIPRNPHGPPSAPGLSFLVRKLTDLRNSRHTTRHSVETTQVEARQKTHWRLTESRHDLTQNKGEVGEKYGRLPIERKTQSREKPLPPVPRQHRSSHNLPSVQKEVGPGPSSSGHLRPPHKTAIGYATQSPNLGRSPATPIASSSTRNPQTNRLSPRDETKDEKPKASRRKSEKGQDAAQNQHEPNKENARFRDRWILASVKEPTFDCGICLETYAQNDIIHIEPCAHAFCKKCIRGFIKSKLKEHRSSILCPMCTTTKSTKKPSIINHLIALQVGLPKKEYELWSNLELATVSVNIMCPKCKRTVFVDRQEYEATSIIPCPLPNCDHKWCKSCQRAVATGVLHSCDGSAELDHLVKSEGWRYCPCCKTLIQKSAGCNHMACRSPGCNAHFCYRCGNLITRSPLATNVNTAVSAHYRHCRL